MPSTTAYEFFIISKAIIHSIELITRINASILKYTCISLYNESDTAFISMRKTFSFFQSLTLSITTARYTTDIKQIITEPVTVIVFITAGTEIVTTLVIICETPPLSTVFSNFSIQRHIKSRHCPSESPSHPSILKQILAAVCLNVTILYS